MKWLHRLFHPSAENPPLPEPWLEILARHATFRNQLDVSHREKLDRGIRHMVQRRNWEGCGGLQLRDEHRVTIAAHAMRLTLGFENDYLSHVASILVYPTAYEAPARQHLGGGVVLEGSSARLGESWYRGPVILAWSDVLSGLQEASVGRNIVLHEFAHQLDYRNGSEADGIPPLETNAEAEEWIAVTHDAFERLHQLCEWGRPSAIDCYGTTNMAEFFAVSSEAFFETPQRLADEWPDLFRVLQRFYRQDPRGA